MVLLVLTSHKQFAQAGTFCATPSNVPNLLQTIPQNQLKTASNAYTVRIFIHIVRRTNGTGGQTQQEINTALGILVGDFEQHNICLSLLGIDEINLDYYYINFTNTKFSQLIQVNSHTNAIDLYLLGNNTTWGSFSGNGRASGIPGGALVIGGNGASFNDPSIINLSTSRILSHEFGHCLGLFHTHHGIIEANCDELVDGSNCTTCGDFVCDTPADPRMGQLNVSAPPNCQWLNSGTDANGDSYNPDERIIMSYSLPNCMQYHTAGQGSRMLSVIANSSLLQNTLVPDDLVLTNTTISAGQTTLYDVQHTIMASNLTVESGGNLTLRAGDQIRVLPGSHIKQGAKFYTSIDSQCSTIDQQNAAKIRNTVNQNNTSLVKNYDSEIKVYPNPTTGQIAIELGTISTSAFVEIYDVMGKKVFAATTSENNLQIDISNQPKGIYLVRVVDGGKVVFTEKTIYQ